MQYHAIMTELAERNLTNHFHCYQNINIRRNICYWYSISLSILTKWMHGTQRKTSDRSATVISKWWFPTRPFSHVRFLSFIYKWCWYQFRHFCLYGDKGFIFVETMQGNETKPNHHRPNSSWRTSKCQNSPEINLHIWPTNAL